MISKISPLRAVAPIFKLSSINPEPSIPAAGLRKELFIFKKVVANAALPFEKPK